MDAAPLALLAVAIGLALLELVMARAVAVLDETEATLRALVTGVGAARRAVRRAAFLAGEVGARARAGEAALGRLEDLKTPTSPKEAKWTTTRHSRSSPSPRSRERPCRSG